MLLDTEYLIVFCFNGLTYITDPASVTVALAWFAMCSLKHWQDSF